MAGFQEELQKFGWTPNSNIRIDFYWGNGIEKRVREQAQQLAKEQPDAIFSVGTAATGAIKDATTSIPVVFAVVNDPVARLAA